jgi:hypothetical protein
MYTRRRAESHGDGERTRKRTANQAGGGESCGRWKS